VSLERQLADYGQYLRQAIADLEVPIEPAVRLSPQETPAHRRRWLVAVVAAAAVVAVVLAVLLWPRSGDPAPFIEEGSTIPGPTTSVPVIVVDEPTTTVPVIVVDDARATTAPVTSPDEPGFSTPDYVGSLSGDGPLLAVSAEEMWTATEWIDPDAEGDSPGSVVWHRQGGVDGVWEWHTLAVVDEVLQLAMTPDGTVWAATGIDGVLSLEEGDWTQRFDGPVGGIAVDAGGTVWIGGTAADRSPTGLWLARWDGETFVRVDPDPQASPVGGAVVLAAGRSDTVWIAPVEQPDFGSISLARFDGETLETVQVEVDPRPVHGWYGETLAIEVAPNGDLWVTGLGQSPYPFIARFDGAVWTVWDWPFGDFPGFGGYFPLYCVMAIGPDGVVWFSWGSGLAGGPSNEGGLGSFDGQEWEIRIMGPSGWAHDGVDVAPDGTVWYLLGDGLHSLDR
jgi:hypothetical protein